MSMRAILMMAAVALFAAACGGADVDGVGYVTVQGIPPGQDLQCGQTGPGGASGRMTVRGSGFLSEHGVDLLVIFTASAGTPFQSGTSATDTVEGQVVSDSELICDLPDLVGTAVVTLTVILPGQNEGISVPGELTIGGLLDGPYAFGDRYETGFEQPLSVPADQGPLFNDFGRTCLPGEMEPTPGNSPPSQTGFTIASYQMVTDQQGTVVMGPDGAFTYTPPQGFEGFDTFTYTMDDQGFQASATVRIGVSTGTSTKPR